MCCSEWEDFDPEVNDTTTLISLHQREATSSCPPQWGRGLLMDSILLYKGSLPTDGNYRWVVQSVAQHPSWRYAAPPLGPPQQVDQPLSHEGPQQEEEHGLPRHVKQPPPLLLPFCSCGGTLCARSPLWPLSLQHKQPWASENTLTFIQTTLEIICAWISARISNHVLLQRTAWT